MRNDWHDLGIDLFVQVRDERRFDRLMVVACQVKSGKSYFGTPVLRDEKVIGWTYRDDAQRFDDWVMHGLPHILVLHDSKKGRCYWAHVVEEAIELTGKGCKIFVPRQQQILKRCRDTLLRVAATQGSGPSVEGSSWVAGADAVPPGRRWRYALVVPRMVAPHPNRAGERAIRPEEAAATAARGRLRVWERAASKFTATPSIAEAADEAGWPWRFASAVAQWFLAGDLGPLATAQASATDPDELASATCALACALASRDRHAEALNLLQTVIKSDSLGPVDHAWLLVQRARYLAETGHPRKARRSAAAGQRALVGASDDVTASAIAAAAASLLFRTAGWAPAGLGLTLAQTDTAASWWRSQELSWGLGEYLENSFESWTQHRALRFGREDEIGRGLFAATIAADHAGDQSSWQAHGGLLARYSILAGLEAGDSGRVSEGLEQLRRVGAADAVSKTVQRLLHSGPVDSLRAVADSIGDESWTHASAAANFKLWQTAGDVMSPDRATSAAGLCLAILRDENHWLLRRVRPRFLLTSSVIPALGGLLRAAGGPVHSAAAELFHELLERSADDLTRHEARSLVHSIDWSHASDEVKGRALSIAMCLSDRDLSCRTLAELAQAGHEPAQVAMADLASDGDLTALAFLGEFGAVSDTALRRIAVEVVGRLSSIVNDAEQGKTGFGRSLDLGALLVSLNLAAPGGADWTTVVRLVLSPVVTPEDKSGAVVLLATRASELPHEVRAELVAKIDSVGRHAPDVFTGQSMARPYVQLAFALGLVSDDEFGIILAQLASSNDPSDRVAAARLIREHGSSPGSEMLSGLLADSHVEVRRATAQAVGACFARNTTPGINRALFSRAATSDGVAIPSALLGGLLQFRPDEGFDRQVQGVLSNLAQHFSAEVRRLARLALDGRAA